MISFQTYQKIQEHKAYGASMLRTSQFMGLSYNTVYKWWDLTEEDFHAFEDSHEFVLDNYRQYFIEQLKITPQMNNTLLYKRLKDDFGDEIEVPMSTFHRYIKNLREQTGYVKPQRQTGLREDPPPGYEAQVDYGQNVMKSMYGNNIRVYFFCMVLSYSEMPVSTPQDVMEVIAKEFSTYDREVFGVLNLKSNGQIINMNICSIGTLNASMVNGREVFKSAILSNAGSFICFHVHPSGNPEPSEEDKAVTEKLATAGKYLDIPLLDHCIIAGGTGEMYSFKANGLMDEIRQNMRTDIWER